MTEYQPDSRLTVSDAKTLDQRCQSVGVAVVGSVCSTDGDVSHIVVEGELEQFQLDALQSEFGVGWNQT